MDPVTYLYFKFLPGCPSPDTNISSRDAQTRNGMWYRSSKCRTIPMNGTLGPNHEVVAIAGRIN